MAKDSGSAPYIPENQLVVDLIKRGVEDNARLLKGFVGPSKREGYVTVHRRLDRLSDSFEVARDDILHFVQAPRSTLGAVVIWVKKDAKIAIRKLETSGSDESRGDDLQEVHKGRLRMRMRKADPTDVCFSHCYDCVSVCSCGTCSSTCTVQR